MCRPVISAQQWRCSLCLVQLSQPSGRDVVCVVPLNQPSSGDVVYVSSGYLRPVVEMQFMFRPVISAQQLRCSLCFVRLSQTSNGDGVCVLQLSQRSNGDVFYVSSSYLIPAMEMQFMCRPVISAMQYRCSLCAVQLSQPCSIDVVYVSSSYLSPAMVM